MNQNIKVLTAETEEGRKAIEEVIQHSYPAEIDQAKPEWALARVVNGVPVSFITIDPANALKLPYGAVEYGFVHDAATREDRRREGHFRGIMENAWERLRAANKPLMALHGRFSLYHRLGFAEYTTNLGIFANPAKVLRILGHEANGSLEDNLQTWEHPQMQADLLVVPEVQAATFEEAKAIFQTSATVALKRGKDKILFQLAPQGLKPPLLDTPFAVMARTCGASIVVQGSDPEGRRVEHTEWVKLIDPTMFLRQSLAQFDGPLPSACIAFKTESGSVTLAGSSNGLTIEENIRMDAEIVAWPSRALAQLALGYLPAKAISVIHSTSISQSAASMLETLFPPQWLLSGDESWVY